MTNEERLEEIKELKAQEKILLDRILTLQKTNGSLTDKVNVLESQIEKMKCCENCKKHRNRDCSEDKKFYARVKRICDDWELAE